MSDDFSIHFNGRDIPAKSGDTILEAAQRAGEHIPTLCHDPSLIRLVRAGHVWSRSMVSDGCSPPAPQSAAPIWWRARPLNV